MKISNSILYWVALDLPQGSDEKYDGTGYD